MILSDLYRALSERLKVIKVARKVARISIYYLVEVLMYCRERLDLFINMKIFIVALVMLRLFFPLIFRRCFTCFSSLCLVSIYDVNRILHQVLKDPHQYKSFKHRNYWEFYKPLIFWASYISSLAQNLSIPHSFQELLQFFLLFSIIFSSEVSIFKMADLPGDTRIETTGTPVPWFESEHPLLVQEFHQLPLKLIFTYSPLFTFILERGCQTPKENPNDIVLYTTTFFTNSVLKSQKEQKRNKPFRIASEG